jgi:hypothetical protein
MHHAGLIADTRPYIVSKLPQTFLSSWELISTFEASSHVHGAGILPHSLIRLRVKRSCMDLVSQGVTGFQKDTGLPSLRYALSSRSMMKAVELLREVVDDCIRSEIKSTRGWRSFVCCYAHLESGSLWRFFFSVYISWQAHLFGKHNSVHFNHNSPHLLPNLHHHLGPECVSPNLLFWHSVQSLVSRLHQPTMEVRCYLQSKERCINVIKRLRLVWRLSKLPARQSNYNFIHSTCRSYWLWKLRK